MSPRQVAATRRSDRSLHVYRSGDQLQQDFVATHRSDKSLRVYCTGRQGAATCPGDTLQRQIAWYVLEDFCENLFRCNKILSSQQVAQIQSDLIFSTCCSDKILLGRQRFSQKSSNTHQAICRCNVSPRHVAATCRPMCIDLWKWQRPFTKGTTATPRLVAATSRLVCSRSQSRPKENRPTSSKWPPKIALALRSL